MFLLPSYFLLKPLTLQTPCIANSFGGYLKVKALFILSIGIKFALQSLYGGLGLHKTLAMNKTFIAKLGWKILTDENNLWARLIQEKYLPSTSLFNCKPKQKDSTIWRHILQLREILQKGLRQKVGNGTDILFWHYNWCAQQNLLSLLNLSTDQVDTNLKLSDFIKANKNWDIAIKAPDSALGLQLIS